MHRCLQMTLTQVPALVYRSLQSLPLPHFISHPQDDIPLSQTNPSPILTDQNSFRVPLMGYLLQIITCSALPMTHRGQPNSGKAKRSSSWPCSRSSYLFRHVVVNCVALMGSYVKATMGSWKIGALPDMVAASAEVASKAFKQAARTIRTLPWRQVSGTIRESPKR